MIASPRLSQLRFPVRRHFAFVVLLMLPLSRGLADPAADLAFNATIRSQAILLFRQGKGADATARLQANVRAGSRGGDQHLETAQQLSDIAFYFLGHRDRALAIEAVHEGISAAQPLFQEKGLDSNRAALFCNLGLAVDQILHDLATSRSFYVAALVAEPTNRTASQRLRAVDERISWKGKS